MHRAETALEEANRQVGTAHADEADVHQLCRRLTQQCAQHVRGLRLGLLRDLQDLYLMANQSDICWTLIGQAAQGARDKDLLALVHDCESQTALQLAWLRTRMKQAAPQVLVVAA